MIRDNRSRPKASVPNQCAVVGGLNWAAKSVSRGAYGAMNGAKTAETIINRMIIAPAVPRGQRRAKLLRPISQRRGLEALAMSRGASVDELMAVTDSECVDQARHRGDPRRN